MQKTFKLEDLCCAKCADEIQQEICKLDGVNSAHVNFLMQKFTLDVADETFENALKQSIKIFKKVEPDCTVIV